MNKTNLLVVGGFLGAGKTTSILAMAKYFLSVGKKIGIVTNDQGSQLVDTNFLLAEGLPVLEVTGGCFCCNFDEFTNKVNQLAENEMPDIILAEPVGSCTDLIATLFKPLQLNYTKQFTLCPLSIVVDPKRVKRLMMEAENSLFPNEINYLFRKQLEEADIIVLNKIDTLSDDTKGEIISFLKENFIGVDVIGVSAKENEGIAQWSVMAASSTTGFNNIAEIDYEVYAKAEEYLGWLNSSVVLESKDVFDVNLFIYTVMNRLKDKFKSNNYEIAHLKIYGVSQNDWTKASITSILDDIDFNKKMLDCVQQTNLIINARVNVDPQYLKPIIEDTLKDVCNHLGIFSGDIRTECFKPGKPQPKYRITEKV